MAEPNSIQTQNLVLTNWLNGVQAPAPEPTLTNELSALGNEAMVGSAFILGLPMFTMPLKKPINTFKQMGKDGKSYSEVWKELSDKTKSEKAALKGNNIWQSYQNRGMYKQINRMGAEIPSFDPNTDISKLNSKQLLKYQNNVTKSAYYGDAKRLIEETKQMIENAKRNGTTISKEQLKTQLNKIREAVRTGDAKLNTAMKNGVIKPTSWFGKAKHQVKLKTGGYKVNGELLKTARGASALKGASKCVKGAGWMAVIQGVMEIPDIISAYKIDKAEEAEGRKSNRGNKQLAKSAVKVGAGVLGYAAGAAATGAIVGSVVPGIGNVAGAVIGFVGGLIGGFIATKAAGKIMDAATGEKDSLDKSEAQIYAEEQNKKSAQEAEQTAKLAALSTEMEDEILAAVKESVDSGNEAPEDVLNAYKYLIERREQSLEGTEEEPRILDTLSNIISFGQA